ncbi:hypothetical protein, partial [Halomonas sp. 25-S5]|uniref:hypothetical protein n=1 Tax=Halomonas sp. 25-S5 TaxID=2994065 RepID=UPI002468573C
AAKRPSGQAAKRPSGQAAKRPSGQAAKRPSGQAAKRQAASGKWQGVKGKAISWKLEAGSQHVATNT